MSDLTQFFIVKPGLNTDVGLTTSRWINEHIHTFFRQSSEMTKTSKGNSIWIIATGANSGLLRGQTYV
jgi:hypothetical protein